MERNTCIICLERLWFERTAESEVFDDILELKCKGKTLLLKSKIKIQLSGEYSNLKWNYFTKK